MGILCALNWCGQWSESKHIKPLRCDYTRQKQEVVQVRDLIQMNLNALPLLNIQMNKEPTTSLVKNLTAPEWS